jgi:hypothetical protein
VIWAEAGPSNPQKPCDLLATGDRARVQDAAESFLASLERKAQPHRSLSAG